MPTSKELIFTALADAVVEMDEVKVLAAAEQVVAQGININEGINKGLSEGMRRVGELYEQEEYFIPELLLCSDVMYVGIEELKKHMPVDSSEKKGKVIIGVIEGDTHDIGKNIVKIMLETSGYEIIDLGRDVPPQRFVDVAIQEEASMIALATLMTTTMGGMDAVVKLLTLANKRNEFKVMIGGGPVSKAYADKIGADGYASNAIEAVRLAGQLIEGLSA